MVRKAFPGRTPHSKVTRKKEKALKLPQQRKKRQRDNGQMTDLENALNLCKGPGGLTDAAGRWQVALSWQ